MHVPYTGCNPRGLMLARGKDLSKTLVHYHRIPVPAFAVFPMGRKVRRPPRLALPLIVKSLIEDGSMGISQASVVDTDEKLAERVGFIHQRIGTAAIAEQYIEGRELYVGVLGNDRLQVLPVWELQFQNMAEGDWHIATEKVKHDPDYQERRGIRHGPAKDLAPEVMTRIQHMAKRIYRTLELDSYARIDFRLAADGTPYFLEANPNPEIAESQEFATAAKHIGIEYPDLLHGAGAARLTARVTFFVLAERGMLMRLRVLRRSVVRCRRRIARIDVVRLRLFQLRFNQLRFLRLRLFDIGESRQAAARQRARESQRIIIHGNLAPGVDRKAGHANNIIARFTR
jgi:D-alanine-D-alanine ligase-like ATP-grasp enzyme